MERSYVRRVGLPALVLSLALASGACEQRQAALVAPEPEIANRIFFDDFEGAQLPAWEALDGEWDLRQAAGGRKQYAARARQYALTVAGVPGWTDYGVSAQITIDDDRGGPVGVAARVQSSHFFYELVLGRVDGVKSWQIRRRINHAWTTLASGPFDYLMGEPQILRFVADGQLLTGLVSTDGGRTFTTLGSADASGRREMVNGRIGLVSYGAEATFDDVVVVRSAVVAAAASPWSPIVLVRDDTNRFPTGKPAGGWYVVGIHGTLRASDGKVLISGWSRKAASGCDTTSSSENSTSWVFDPATFDPNVSPFMITSLDEQNLDPANGDAIYCAGHTTLPDGRIFVLGGSRHPGNFPHTMGELGLNYSRVFDPFDNSAGVGIGKFTRISAPMKGGPANGSPLGTKWYPTATNMPDGKVMTFGGFSYNGGGTGDRMNQSFELFDPAAWTANPSGDPWTVLTTHEEGQLATTPTRGYTNVFLLPKPVPAGSAAGGGFARSMALMAGAGQMFLYNHEPGPSGAARLVGRSTTTNPSMTEKGEGSSGVVLPDGRIMFINGGHSGLGSANAYFYNPYTDSWTETPPLPLGTSRIYGDALWLPDGTVMIINGYVSEAGNTNDVQAPLQAAPPADPAAPPRSPEIIDPFNMTVTTLPPTPETVTRGYHSIAVLLKDGRILIAGGKDAGHATGCEKNELRVFEPPYLSAGPRPVNQAAQGTAMTVGGAPIAINYTGTLRAARAVSLMAPGSLTHGFDMGQRYVPLTYSTPSAGTLVVNPPSNVNIAPPGDYIMYLISDLGGPSLGVHIKLGAPPACTYAIDGDVTTYLEAEGRSRQDGPFVDVTDATVSAGHYMQVTNGSGDHTSLPDEGKVMWYDLNVFNGGSFFVYLHGNGPDATSATAWVSIDGNLDVQYTAPVGAWGWAQVGAAAINIPTGLHTLKIKVRQDGLKIDKVSLAKTAGLPSGQGSTALACNNAPPVLTWIDQDIGATTFAGSSTQAGGTFTVKGSGADITGTADAFHFVYKTLSGDGSITARLTSLTGGDNNNTAKAGVMMRDPGADGLGANDVNAFTMVKPNSTQNKFQRRLTSGATTASTIAATATQKWLRLTRTGNTVLSEHSNDGVTWTTIGSDTVTMTSVKVGLAVTGHSTAALATAVFDNITITTPTSPPGPPTNLVAVSGNNKVTLTWTAPSGSVTSYTVKRATVMNGPYPTLQGGITAPTFTDNTAVNGTTYFYVVSATNGAGEGMNSGEANATPAPPPPPPAPTGVMATPGNNQVGLVWNPVSGATSYTVKRGTTSGVYTFTQPNIMVANFTDTTAVNGTQYFYVVSATGPGGEGANSAPEVPATPTLPPPPPAPTGLVATPGNNQVGLVWNPVSGATSYTVKRGTTSGVYTFTQPNVMVASFTDSTAVNGTAYLYVVSATGPGGEGPNSTPEVPATPSAPTGPSAPTNLAATIANGNAVTLSWTDTSSNETGFRVERKVGTGSFALLATKTAGTQSHTDGPTLAANTYTYRVIATGPPDSAPSGEVVVVLRNPEADAHVRDGTASVNNNYGANPIIEVKNTTAAGNNRQAFVRFTLADVASTVTSAKIRLFGASVTTIKSIAISAVSDITWVEGTGTIAAPVTATGIDWTGKPAIGAQLTTQNVGITAVWTEFDVTAYVQAQKTAGATKVSFAVTMATVSNDAPTTFNTLNNGSNKPLVVISSR